MPINSLWTLCLLQKSSNRCLEKESMTKSKKLWYTRYSVLQTDVFSFSFSLEGRFSLSVRITNTITILQKKLEITRSTSLVKFIIFSHFERSTNEGFTLCAVVRLSLWITERKSSLLSFLIFRGHGNKSCNLIGSLSGQYFPISAHGPWLRFRESPSTSQIWLPFFINISRFSGWAVFLRKHVGHYLNKITYESSLSSLSYHFAWQKNISFRINLFKQ